VPFDLPFVIPCLIADPIILAVNIRERACSSFSTHLDISWHVMGGGTVQVVQLL
jgi:hypothetical protein